MPWIEVTTGQTADPNSPVKREAINSDLIFRMYDTPRGGAFIHFAATTGTSGVGLEVREPMDRILQMIREREAILARSA